MEFCHSFPFVTYVKLTIDRFVGSGDEPVQSQKQDSHFFSKKNWLISSDLLEKSKSSLHRRLSLRIENRECNFEHGMDMKMNATSNCKNLWVCSAN